MPASCRSAPVDDDVTLPRRSIDNTVYSSDAIATSSTADLDDGRQTGVDADSLDWQTPDVRQLVPTSTAEILGRRIVTGDLAPGTTLPNIVQLAEQFSISRLSMREAIKLLVGKRLVSSAPRRGTVVQPRNEWSRLDPDVLVWQIGDVPSAALVRNLGADADRATRRSLAKVAI